MMTPTSRPSQLVVIGASAGGVTAIQRILKALPRDFHLPIAVTYHIPADASFDVGLVFSTNNGSKIVEAEDKMPIEFDRVYFSPPGYHLLVGRDHRFALSQDELVCYSRPSIDVLFESAAGAFGKNAIGIILTGANQDGSTGLQAIAEVGGTTIVQDPKDAESSPMPLHAIEKARPQFILPLAEIASHLQHYGHRELSRG